MRIISGKYRGLKLCGFEGRDIRPTADRIKESLFNILADRVAFSAALDLFCGSGALGLECISRGADFVCFNDNSPASIAVLTQNLKKIPNEKAYAVTRLDYAAFLKNTDRKFDIIFIDPPYASEAGTNALKLIGENAILKSGGIAVYERDRKFDGEIKGLKIVDERKYGITYLTFFQGE